MITKEAYIKKALKLGYDQEFIDEVIEDEEELLGELDKHNWEVFLLELPVQ